MIRVTSVKELQGEGWVVVDGDEGRLYSGPNMTTEEMVGILNTLGVGAEVVDPKPMTSYNVVEVLNAVGKPAQLNEVGADDFIVGRWGPPSF